MVRPLERLLGECWQLILGCTRLRVFQLLLRFVLFGPCSPGSGRVFARQQLFPVGFCQTCVRLGDRSGLRPVVGIGLIRLPCVFRLVDGLDGRQSSLQNVNLSFQNWYTVS